MADGHGSPPWQPERSINVSTQLQTLRDLLNSDRNSGVDSQRALEAMDQEISARSNTLERQRRELDSQLQERETPPAASDGITSSNNASPLVRSRRRPYRPSERLQRQRERLHLLTGRTDSSDSVTNTRRVTPPPPFAESAMDEYVTEPQVNREQRCRAKRRKLDDGTFDDDTRSVTYGDEGRVTPGPLKMEIIQCDGGEYLQPPTGMAQHILQDDKNVYSTKENKCNMLLKHLGGLPFSLTKIVIKAPSDGYDSPIQEGMIFVALDDDRLMDKTSHYDRYSPKSYRFHHPHRRHDYYRPSQEYLNSSRSPLRSIDRSRYLRDPHLSWSHLTENDSELETSTVPGFNITFANPPDSEDSHSFTPRSPSSWRDLDADYSLRPYTDRYRPPPADTTNRDSGSATSSESEDDYVPTYRDRSGNFNDDLEESFAQQRRLLTRMRVAHERSDRDFYAMHPSRRPQEDNGPVGDPQRRPPPNRSNVRSTHWLQTMPTVGHNGVISKPNDPTSQPSVAEAGLLPPHARFSMPEMQRSIAINFDPPVAGRYILIKLWASCPASNIDIQCIMPHGYGGPRFFPSIQPR